MRNNIWIGGTLAALVSATLGIGCAEVEEPTPEAETLTACEALVEVTPDALDFGALHRGETGTLEVTIHNTSADDVALNNVFVSGSAALSIAEYPELPTTLASGATLTVEVRYTPELADGDEGVMVINAMPTDGRCRAQPEGLALQVEVVE